MEEIDDDDLNLTYIIPFFHKTLRNKPLMFRPTKQRACIQEQLHVSALTVRHLPTNTMFLQNTVKK